MLLIVLATGGLSSSVTWAQVRPVDVAPAEDDIGGGYTTPEVQRPRPVPTWRHTFDVGLLVVALGLATWIVLARRSRVALVVLTLACLAYFGFYREGCVCPIGATQNVSVALTDARYAIPYWVIAVFFLPLVAALLFGRVFCGGVCPLGAIQDIVLLRPLRVPRRLDRALGVLKYVYLAAAIWFAVQPLAGRDFIICRFDPFVGMFRLTGTLSMFLFGGALLALGLFVGRPYCRWLCPYGALLAVLSRVSWRGFVISPAKELDCGLCSDACPFGAIENNRAVKSRCLFCARCYASCPEHRRLRCGAAPGKANVPRPEALAGSGSEREGVTVS